MVTSEQPHDPRACDGVLTKAFGFLGTPAYIVGTVVFPGVPSMADFRQAIADARAKSG